MGETEKPLRLYRVTLEYDVAVLARSDDHARFVGIGYAEQVAEDVEPCTSAALLDIEALTKNQLRLRPYCDFDDNPDRLTCAEILAGGLDDEPVAPTEADMEAAGQLNALEAM